MLHQAIDLQQSGNLKAAERKYRNILKTSPGHSDALQFLAVLLQQKGNSQAANHFMQKALKAAPDNPLLLSNQAEIYRMQGNFNQAEDFANMALSLNDRLVDPLVILGSVYQTGKQYLQATEYFTKALDINPEEFEVRNELGNTLSVLGRYHEAVEHYQIALAQQPGFDDCRVNLADSLMSLDEIDQAISHYKTILSHQPRLISVHIKLGKAYEIQGQRTEATNSFQTALGIDPLSLSAIFNLGKHLLDSEPDRTLVLFTIALKINNTNAEAHYWLGVHSQTMGLFHQASDYFLQAIELQPEYFNAWYRLSLNQGFTPSAEQLQQIESQYNAIIANTPNDPNIPALGFSLGRFAEQKGDYSAAFGFFDSANRFKAINQPFDRTQHDAQVENIIKLFNHDFFDQRKFWGNPTVTPVFIIGMPRSGTTLVEQIIASHADVFGAGERQSMLSLVNSLKHRGELSSTSHAQRLGELSQSAIAKIADDYIEDLQGLNSDAIRITDKMPGNYFRLGVIFLLFPNAKIIHCQREPMDTCWSCYQQNFERGLRFTNNLEDLAHAYGAYQRLMHHWHRIKPGVILNIEYESLLKNPKAQSRRLLEHCGLDWDPAVLEFHQQPRPVTTASVWQVRQPMYQSSVNRWKAYESQLQPLQRLLYSTSLTR